MHIHVMRNKNWQDIKNKQSYNNLIVYQKVFVTKIDLHCLSLLYI